MILTGEHFVVLGAPALSMAIDLHSTANARRGVPGEIQVEVTVPVGLVGQLEMDTIKPKTLLRPLRLAAETALRRVHQGRGRQHYGTHVHVECEIPIGAGLGSSASTSVAIIAAVAASEGRRLTQKDIFELAYAPEKLVHNKPSGIDQATSTFGGIIQYERGGVIEKIRLKEPPCMVICDTGVHRSTGRLVGAVVRRSKRKELRRDYLERVGEVTEITRRARRALERGNREELGELMNKNQELLRQINVSHPMLERLILTARKSGALGAKLTGAGGGGCVVALCEDDTSRQKVAGSLARAGGFVYNTRLSSLGVAVMP